MIGPEGTAYSRTLGTSEQDDREILEMLSRQEWGSDSPVCINGDFLGTYIEESKLFQPTVREDQVRVMVAQWFDAEFNYLGTEKLMFSIRFTDTLPATVDTSKIPAEQIIASEEGDPVITTSLGSIRFEYPMGSGTAQLETFVICPAYFDDDPDNDPGYYGDDTYTSGWSCTSAELGDEWEADLQWLTTSIPNADGSGPLGHYLVARVGSAPVDLWREHASTRSYNVVWYQDQETDEGMTRVPVQRGTLIQTHVVGEPDEWPIYIDELSPVALNATDITAVNAVEGLTAQFANGILRIGVEDDKLPSGEDLSRAHYTVKVTPPVDSSGEPAVYYKWNRSGGSNIFDFVEESWIEQEEYMFYAEYKSVADEPFELYIEPCSRYTSKINDELTLSIYLSNEITPEFAGDVNLLYWYSEDGDDEDEEPDLICKQYLVERYDPIMHIQESQPFEDESEITSPVELPAIVVFEKGGRHKYTLRITSYPQDEGDMIYYDLTLVDKKGNEIALSDIDKHNNKRCKIYIPYPDGHSYGTNVKYNIHHLNSKHHAKEYFSEDSEEFKVYRTEYGLCIEVNDLSPFVLSWGNAWSGGTESINVLRLPENLVSIREEAFMDGDFEEVIIPDTCILIGKNAFANVENLVVHMPDSDELVVGESAFDYETATFIVPNGSLAHRMAVENWWNYEIKYY